MDGLVDDDYDPLAPVYVDEADDEEDLGADPGITDSTRIVRVWFDDDGELTRVHVSPIWHRKLGHRTLSDVFESVLAGARYVISPPQTAPDEPDLTGVDFSGLARFGRDPFTTFRLALENVNRRWVEAAQRAAQHRPVPKRPIEASDDNITVRLDEEGHPVSVEFDEDWLDDAEVAEINDGVVRMVRRARARFEPVEPARDELADLVVEHEILMQGLQRLLSGKGI